MFNASSQTNVGCYEFSNYGGFPISCNLVNQDKNLSCSGLGLGVGNIVLQQMQGLKECYLLENNLWHL
jgi:hypothetical protein